MSHDADVAAKNIELGFEFGRYLLSHPQLEAKIPDNALIIFEVANDARLTQFNRRLAKRTRRPGQPIVLVHIDRLLPSRLLAPKVTRVRAASRAR